MTDANHSIERFAKPPSQLSETDFVARFGGVYEHSAWIAQSTWRRGLGPAEDTVSGLARALAQTVTTADREQQLTLIRAHPDLAGRAAVRGDMTEDSTEEQASAGLDRCTTEQLERFQVLNAAYKAKFGFPFIMAVRGHTREAILSTFEQRLGNNPDTEFLHALDEIHAIARLRLYALASS